MRSAEWGVKKMFMDWISPARIGSGHSMMARRADRRSTFAIRLRQGYGGRAGYGRQVGGGPTTIHGITARRGGEFPWGALPPLKGR